VSSNPGILPRRIEEVVVMKTAWRRGARTRVAGVLGIALSLLVAVVMAAEAQTYQGFGASTRGGTGGATVHVTNLNNSGPGSLREAVSQGNRTVVFDVGGEIILTDYVYVLGPFVTIDGFTAPSPGIALRNRGLIIRGTKGAHDVIVRGIRVRNSAIDGIQVAYGAYNVVIDHVSAAGSVDGNIDITEDSHDVTVSWSILAGNEKNMLVKYNPSRVTLHHNVFTEGHTRNPQIRIDDAGGVATQITGDIRNNIFANWTNGYGTLLWFGAWGNVVNNYYTASNKAIQVLSARGYVKGNQSANGVDLNGVGNVASPFPSAPVLTQDACTAARLVLADAGARPLDSVDQQYLARIPVPSCSGASSSLQVSPTSLGFDATVGGLEPLPQQLTIVEQAGGRLDWTAALTNGGSWLAVTPAGGTAPSSLTVTTDPRGLAQGIYQGTIVLTAPGATNSPQSIQVTLLVDPASAEEGRVGAGIVAGADDAREYVTGIVKTKESYILLGRGNLIALRFSDVDVPRGAVIQSAVVELYGAGAPTASVALRYDAEDVGHSAPFVTANGSLSSRPRTQAFVDDVPGPWSYGAFNASPDLKAIVQEVVERADWRPGNSLTLFINDSDSDQTRRIGSFEGSPSPSRAAQLTILYQVP
jgi:pectate lyase